jgi:hypothetical protein
VVFRKNVRERKLFFFSNISNLNCVNKDKGIIHKKWINIADLVVNCCTVLMSGTLGIGFPSLSLKMIL